MTGAVRSYGEKWHGYRSAPPPPPDINREMQTAGKNGDDVALGLAHARYEQWLTEQGHDTRHQGTNRPDGAIR